MSAPAIVWIVIGTTTTVAVAAMIAALVRHVLLLGRTLRRFQEEIQPISEEIAAGSARASQGSQRLGSELPFGRR